MRAFSDYDDGFSFAHFAVLRGIGKSYVRGERETG